MDTVLKWLAALGLEKHGPVFEEQEIGFDVLPDLTGDDLKELGIPLGDRKRLLRAIAELQPQQQASQPPSDPNASGRSGKSDAERRQVTIVFCDLVGSTKLASRLDPEDLNDLMAAYQGHCQRIVDKWQGHIAEFLGDGVVIWFGWPKAWEHDSERAVHAALELVEACGTIQVGDGTSMQARAGIATGKVMVGDIRNEVLLARQGVVGETPNLAARAQAVAPPGCVVITPQTRELIGNRFELEGLGMHEFKGIDRPVSVWCVLGIQATTRFEVLAKESTCAFVGRSNEVAALMKQWRVACSGNWQSALLSGEAGIGKSRLLQEFFRQVESYCSLIHLHGSPYHENSVLMPFVEWVRQVAGIAGDVASGDRLDRLQALATERGVDPATAVPLLAALLAIPLDGRFVAPSLSMQLQRERTFELLIDLMQYGVSTQPLLLLVEDLHWADPTTLDLLRQMISRRRPVPCMLLMTTRPKELGLSGDNLVRHELHRLDKGATKSLVALYASRKRLPESVMSSIVEAADGVPLFIEELTRSVLASDHLRDAGDHFELVGDGKQLDVPATLHDLLVARLDSLPAGKPLAHIASTLGRTFSLDLLMAVMPPEDGPCEPQIEQLCRHRVLEPVLGSGGDRKYTFCHALLREAAYQSQLKARRREVHARVAQVLEASYSGVVENEPEVLAHHFAECDQNQRAADYLLRAGENSLRASAAREAITHFARGISLLGSLPASRERDRVELRMQALLGTTWMHAKSWGAEEVERAYLAAGRLAHASETVAEQVWVLWGIWVFYHVRGRITDSLRASEPIESLATRTGDAHVALIRDMILLQNRFYAGDLRTAEQHCQQFLANYEAARDGKLTAGYSTDLELVCLVHRAKIAWVSGRTTDARGYSAQARARAESLHHPYSVAWCNTWGAVLDIFLGDKEAAEQRIRLGRAMASEHDYAYVRSMADLLLAYLAAEHGSGAELEAMRSCIASFRATGAEIVVPFFQTMLAERQLASGDARGALELLQEADNRIARYGEGWQRPEVLRLQANALLVIGECEAGEVEATYRKALQFAQENGALAWQRRVVHDLADFLHRSGRVDEARALGGAIKSRGDG